MKKILIINGNPDKNSLSFELATAYKKGADASGAACTLVHLSDLQFDLNLKFGYRQRTELEPDLVMMQQAIKEADHLVFVYPTWWGTYPTLLKGFIDRVFLPKFAFSYRENSPLWDKLFVGKTARLIVTMYVAHCIGKRYGSRMEKRFGLGYYWRLDVVTHSHRIFGANGLLCGRYGKGEVEQEIEKDNRIAG